VSRDWWFDWRGECVAIVAAGPSVTQENVNKLRDRIHVIVINESHRLAPWADMLYACDANWWRFRNGVKEFVGVKVTQDDAAARTFNLKRIVIRKKDRHKYFDDLLTDDSDEIGSGGNGGFQCVNMATRFGATGIALVGFDYRLFGNTVHWHGRHGGILPNPDHTNFPGWIKHITAAAPVLQSLGVDVVNTSLDSAIKIFPKMTIEQTLERWGL